MFSELFLPVPISNFMQERSISMQLSKVVDELFIPSTVLKSGSCDIQRYTLKHFRDQIEPEKALELVASNIFSFELNLVRTVQYALKRLVWLIWFTL